MISIDREMLWQWDYGQRVQLHDVPVGTKVHFSNAAIKPNALVTEAYEDGEGVYANIPNIMLQTAGTLSAYIYIEDGDEGHTEYKKLFIVRDRERPDDYVYTDDEVKTWEALEERVKALEESGGGAAGGLIRPLSTIGEIDGVTIKEDLEYKKLSLTVEMTAESKDSVFGGNKVYKNDYADVRQIHVMLRVPGMGKMYEWELFEDDLISVVNYPSSKIIMVSTNRMIASFTYDDSGNFVSSKETYQANVQQLNEAKATIPNSATVNEDNELVMQHTEGDAVSELFRVRLPQGGGTGGGDNEFELYKDITIEENVNIITVELPENFNELLIYMTGMRTETTGAHSNNFLKLNSDAFDETGRIAFSDNWFNTTVIRCVPFHMIKLKDESFFIYWPEQVTYPKLDNNFVGSTVKVSATTQHGLGKIETITLHGLFTSFVSGFKIAVYMR